MRYFKDPYIRSITLIGFAACVDADEEAVVGLLRSVGISEDTVHNIDTTISFRKYAILFELAAQKFDEPNFGLRQSLCQAPEFPHIGPVVFLSKFSNTLEQWLRLAMKYWTHHTNGFTLDLVQCQNPNFTCLRYQAVPGFYPSRQLIENAMANILILCRNATGLPDASPTIVRFRHRRPADIALHEEIFNCKIEFGALHDEFVVEKEILELPTRGSLTFFRSLVDAYMKARGALLPPVDQPIETSVALAISSVIGTQRCNIDEVAVLLGVSTKKLQRLLVDENTSFSDILDRSRESISRQFLGHSDIPVANIAGLLDYSSPSSFILAFKRWSGTTPLAYRKAVQDELE